MNYVLITPARNEGRVIQFTLESMLAQTRPPLRWVIVDDGSTDDTAQLVETVAARCPWVELVRLSPRQDRTFAGKVHAFNAGLARLSGLRAELIGNLDAD